MQHDQKKILIYTGIFAIAIFIVIAMLHPTSSAPEDFGSVVKDIESDMIEIAGGAITMGQNNTFNESPAHRVDVTTFKLLKHEVSQNNWKLIMKDDKFTNTAQTDLPATNISWNDAQRFINKLNGITNKQYRLPTENEWEYACLKGSDDNLGINKVSWNKNNSNNTIHIVQTKKVDKIGLYDMLGNAYEWCEDWYSPYLKENIKAGRVLRGGDYKNDIELVNGKIRNFEVADKQSINIGFRIALSGD